MNRWTRWQLAAVATMGAMGTVALGAGSASADEHYSGNTKVGPRTSIISTGQIDDPMEDVLEHAAILGSFTITND